MKYNGSQIRGVLENELRKQLSFTFTLKRNLSRPGSCDLRKGDRVVLAAWARNDGDIPFTRVSGLLSKTPMASFRAIPFELRGLAPREERVAATVQAIILQDSNACSDCEWIAKLTVVTTVNLSEFQVTERERCIAYTPSRKLSATGGRPRFIPLSEAPPSPL